jgi:uncharacterized protein (TIGR02996 family)
MTTRDALFRAILDNPDDDAVRLIYADCLEDEGETARAEFIRVQIALTEATVTRRAELHAREQELRSAHEQEWAAPLRRLVSHWEFHRGFIDEVRVEARAFTDRVNELFRHTPLQRLALYWRTADPPHERARFVPVVIGTSHLRQIRELDLSDNYLGSGGVRALAVCDPLTSLSSLNLAGNHIGDAGARALADADLLAQLTHLDLSRNDLGTGAVRALSAGLRARQAEEDLVLRTLNLSGNRLGPTGVRAVDDCPVLRRVARL